jgi:hypothetical protein
VRPSAGGDAGSGSDTGSAPDDGSSGPDVGVRPLPNRDAGPKVSADADLPQREPDAGVRTRTCGTLEPWVYPAGVLSATVLKGGDGFVGLFSEVGTSSISYTPYVFDSRGDATLRVGELHASSPTGYGLVGNGAGSGTTAALAKCSGQGFGCGSVLLIAGQRPLTVQAPVLLSANPHLAVAKDGKMVLATLALPNDLNPGAMTELDRSNQSYEIRLLDRTGHVLTAVALPVQDFGLVDMAISEAGTVLLLGRLADTDASGGIDEVIVSLDADLKQQQVTVVPARRTARSVVSNARGQVIVVGTAVGPDGSRVWLNAFETVTLEHAWPAERVGALGVGIAVDVNPSGEIATLATTAESDGFVVEKYDSDGERTGDPPLVARIAGDPAPSGSDPSIAFQTDGSIFVTTPIGAFVSCW